MEFFSVASRASCSVAEHCRAGRHAQAPAKRQRHFELDHDGVAVVVGCVGQGRDSVEGVPAVGVVELLGVDEAEHARGVGVGQQGAARREHHVGEILGAQVDFLKILGIDGSDFP